LSIMHCALKNVGTVFVYWFLYLKKSYLYCINYCVLCSQCAKIYFFLWVRKR